MRLPSARFPAIVALFLPFLAVPSFAGVPPFAAVSACSGGVGLPEPHRSTVGLSSPAAACQYLFRADGAFPLTLNVTVRDAFDTPVPNLEVDATVSPGAGAVFCACEPVVQTHFTDAAGVVPFVFSRFGGRGTLDLGVTATVICDGVPQGQLWIWSGNVDFTSPDLDGSCEAAGSTTIFDLGRWASGLPPGYDRASDYTCDGVVNVFDLGEWAGGLGRGCSP